MPEKVRGQQIADLLRNLRSSSPDIQASALVSTDGLIVASDLPQGAEEDRVSAMSAAMLSLGDRISIELQRGELEQVYIRGKNGYVLLTAANDETVLTVLAQKNAKLGLVFLDVKRAATDVGRLI